MLRSCLQLNVDNVLLTMLTMLDADNVFSGHTRPPQSIPNCVKVRSKPLAYSDPALQPLGQADENISKPNKLLSVNISINTNEWIKPSDGTEELVNRKPRRAYPNGRTPIFVFMFDGGRCLV